MNHYILCQVSPTIEFETSGKMSNFWQLQIETSVRGSSMGPNRRLKSKLGFSFCLILER